MKPTHMIGGYAQQSWGFNYYGTVGSNRDEFVIVRKLSEKWTGLNVPPAMQRRPQNEIRAQIGMVLNLDKCIGCHTCSVTCKNVWTNREGVEYAWFNNVETKPGVGYPKDWENQKPGGRAAGRGLPAARSSPRAVRSGGSWRRFSPIPTCRRSTITTSPSPSTTSISRRPRRAKLSCRRPGRGR